MEALFQQFVKEKTYLANVTPATLRHYKLSFTCFRKHYKGELPTKGDLNLWVIGMKESGLPTVSCNTYIPPYLYFSPFIESV